MLQRILRWLFPAARGYRITRHARAQMRAMSLAAHPRETAGVLVGKRQGDVVVIDEVIYQPFASTERQASIAIDRYTIAGMVGTFHSHPVPDDRPSAADKRLFAHYAGLHCIVPYPYRRATVFNRAGERLATHDL